MRKALVQIQGVFAELDKSLLVRKLRKGREAVRATKGRCEGQKPYGHYDGEQEVLRRMRALRRKPRGGRRLSYQKVADQLNTEGFSNRSGGPWTRAHVHKVLSK